MFGHKLLFLFFTESYEIIGVVMFFPAFSNYYKDNIYNVKSDLSRRLSNPFIKKQALLFYYLQYIPTLYWSL